MEEQTAKSDVRNGQQNDVTVLQSMLMKLPSPKKRVGRRKKSTFKSYVQSETTCPSVSEECIENEDRNNLNSEVRSDGDEEQPTRSSKTEDGNEGVEESRDPPEDFHKCAIKSCPPVSLSMKTQGAESIQGGKEGEFLEDKNNDEPSVEENMAGAASLLNSSSQQSSADTSHLLMPSDRCDIAQMEFEKEELEEACGGPSKPADMDPNSVLTHETDATVTSRTARSASDPVAQKHKEENPLSASSISNLQEYEKVADAMKRQSKAAIILGWEESDMSFSGVEQENSVPKMQKKGVKNKMKNLTHKLMEKFKEKQDCEHADSKSIQDSGEEEAQCMDSMELKVESSEAPPLPSKKGKYVVLERTFTLKDFKLNLEPINLMEEIFTGEEWLRYLPSKTSPADIDTSDQPLTFDVLQTEKETLLNIPLLTPQQDQTEDIKNSQDDASVAQEENAAKVNSELYMEKVKQDPKTFAIPKALLTNNGINQRASDCESKKSGDIYDCLDMYIIPKNDSKSSDALLMDFSAVKSSELLDNSALKSRIRLSKKRAHKPPQKKVKTEKSTTKFYKIPEDILNEPPVSPSPPFNSIPFSKSPPHSSPLFPGHT